MALETVVHISDLVPANPASNDLKSQGDDHIRNIKTALANDFAGFTGAVSVTGTDGGVVNAYTLTPASPLVAYGTKMGVVFAPNASNTGTASLNISGLGAKAIKRIDGVDVISADLASGSVYVAVYNGTEFRLLSPTKNYIDQLAFTASLPAKSLGLLVSDGTTATFSKTTSGFALNQVKGADIASAATIDLTNATGNFIHVTGTTTITAITIPIGAERTVIFDGALTLTYGAALLLPSGANITTAAGDRAIIRGDTAGANVIAYVKASGAPIVQSGFTNMLVAITTQTWTPPVGTTKAKITVVGGGSSGGTDNSAYGVGGKGGGAAISTISVSPAVTYTATIGAGGIGPLATTTLSPNAGGTSSFSGSGIATISATGGTSTSPGIGSGGAVILSGGYPMLSGVAAGQNVPGGGSSFLSGSAANSVAGLSYGGAGGGGLTSAAGPNGFAGVVIIEY